jgi:hypothetical protein
MPIWADPSCSNDLEAANEARVNELDREAFALVLERLRTALNDSRGKLRASDALTLAGFDGPSYHRTQIVARALRELGWERGRYRFNGSLLYAYGRGTQLDREVMLQVERGSDGTLVVKPKNP